MTKQLKIYKMKKTMIILSLALGLNVNAQKSEAYMQQMKRADMVTFATFTTYVASYGLEQTKSLKEQREARLFIALGMGAVFGCANEIVDVKKRYEKFSIEDVGYMVAGGLIGFALSEATIAIKEKAEKRKYYKKLRL